MCIRDRPGADRRSAARHPAAGRRAHDYGDRYTRDAVCQRAFGSRDLHGKRSGLPLSLIHIYTETYLSLVRTRSVALRTPDKSSSTKRVCFGLFSTSAFDT